MLQIAFPNSNFQTRKADNYDEIFDPLRKKWLKLTPEEWVRQNFVQYLVTVMQYPASLIAQEREIKLGEMKKRFDIVVFDRMGAPWMLIECKAMEISLTDKVLSQVLAYKSTMPCPFVIITNGNYSCGWKLDATAVTMLEEMPVFPA
jgi:hypothetical protein